MLWETECRRRKGSTPGPPPTCGRIRGVEETNISRQTITSLAERVCPSNGPSAQRHTVGDTRSKPGRRQVYTDACTLPSTPVPTRRLSLVLVRIRRWLPLYRASHPTSSLLVGMSTATSSLYLTSVGYRVRPSTSSPTHKLRPIPTAFKSWPRTSRESQWLRGKPRGRRNKGAVYQRRERGG